MADKKKRKTVYFNDTQNVICHIIICALFIVNMISDEKIMSDYLAVIYLFFCTLFLGTDHIGNKNRIDELEKRLEMLEKEKEVDGGSTSCR